MIQIPSARSEKIVVAIMLVFVVVVWTLDSALHPNISNSDLNNVAVMVAKDINPDLFPTDFTFSEQSFYQAYTPVYRSLVGYLWQRTGNFEAGLVWLVPFVLAVYVVGMFLLLFRVSQNTWLALGLTVASAHYHEMMGAEVWGVGGSSQIMARALFMAVVPYIALWFLWTIQQISFLKIGILGLWIGLAANLHPGSGMHLAILLGSTLLLAFGLRRTHWQIWLMLPLMVVTTLLGAVPMIRAFTGNISGGTGDLTTFDIFRQAIHDRYQIYFYPRVFEGYGFTIARPTLDFLVWLYLALALIILGLYLWTALRAGPAATWWRWIWLGGGLITVGYAHLIALFEMRFLFMLVAAYIIYRFLHPHFDFLDWLMLGMMSLVILQSFVGYYLMSLVWERFGLVGITPLLIEQFRAARFVYLPIYILAALAARLYAQNTPHWLNEESFSRTQAILILSALLLGLLPGLSDQVDFWLGLVIVVVTVGIIATLIKLPTWPVWLSSRYAGIALMIFLVLSLFGPLAVLFAPIAPIPAINILNPVNRVPDTPWLESDTQLYEWVRGNTDSTALFFWCDFGPSTTLRFRREAQRGITHNWKDLGWAAYNGTTLVPLLDRYRLLERACTDTIRLWPSLIKLGPTIFLCLPQKRRPCSPPVVLQMIAILSLV